MYAKLGSCRCLPILTSRIVNVSLFVKISSSTFGNVNESIMCLRNSICSENIQSLLVLRYSQSAVLDSRESCPKLQHRLATEALSGGFHSNFPVCFNDSTL